MNNKSQRFEIKAHEDGKGSFTAYGNVFDVIDDVNDITMKGAFSNTIQEHKSNGTMPRLLAQHGHTSMPIGIITDMIEDDKGLKFSGELNLETQAGREAYALMKQGAIDTFSIGYLTQESEDQMVDGKAVRALLDLDVREISLVTFASNKESRIESIKSALEQNEKITTKMVQKALQESGLSNRQAEQAINQIKAPDLAIKESEMTTKITKEQKVDVKSTKDTEQISDKNSENKIEQKIEQKAGYWMKETLDEPIVSVSCLQEVLRYLSPTAHAAMIEIAEADRVSQLMLLEDGEKSDNTKQETKDNKIKVEQKSTEFELTKEEIQDWFKE